MTTIKDPTRARRLRGSLGRRGVVVSLALGLGLLVASVATVGAVEATSTPRTPAPPAAPQYPVATTLGHWSVPRDESGAPTVPTSGGAATGSGGFNAVSCPTASECVAVGGDGQLGGVASTSQNAGSTWAQGAMDADEPVLNAIDCSSATVCVAVGQGATVRSSNGGSTWTSSSIPSANTTLLSVACASTTTCVSVGVSPNATGPYAGQLLVSTNGGSAWKVPTVPASYGALGSVACPTTSFCVAVGSSILVSTNGGMTWSERSVNGGTGVLRSVSCSSAQTCVAVGGNPAVAQDPAAPAYAVETTDGGATWSSLAMPAGSGTLDVVACASGNCAAAGSSLNGAPTPVYTSDNGGGAWTPDQSVASSITAVSGLTCNSATSCVFTGQFNKSPVIVSTSNGAPSANPVAPQVRTQKDLAR